MAQYLENWQDRSECQAVPRMSEHVLYRQQCVMSWPCHTGQMHQVRHCAGQCTQHCLWVTEKCVRTARLNLTEYHKATVLHLTHHTDQKEQFFQGIHHRSHPILFITIQTTHNQSNATLVCFNSVGYPYM